MSTDQMVENIIENNFCEYVEGLHLTGALDPNYLYVRCQCVHPDCAAALSVNKVGDAIVLDFAPSEVNGIALNDVAAKQLYAHLGKLLGMSDA